MPARPTFLGAARTVTGSKHLLETHSGDSRGARLDRDQHAIRSSLRAWLCAGAHMRRSTTAGNIMDTLLDHAMRLLGSLQHYPRETLFGLMSLVALLPPLVLLFLYVRDHTRRGR